MMKRIKRFGIYQTSKVAAIIYFLISAIFVSPFALVSSLMGTNSAFSSVFPFGGGVFFIIIPFFYGIVGFIVTAISCFFYNLTANWTGGIEVEIETRD